MHAPTAILAAVALFLSTPALAADYPVYRDEGVLTLPRVDIPEQVGKYQEVTFRLTSRDLIHGFQVIGTNANVMVVPGYVSQFTVTFSKPGEYAIACNEYCGIMHHQMVGKLVVK